MFRGQDLSRLMMMLVLLCVVGILFFRARDPRTWKWFARGDADASSSAESKEVAAKQLARAETLATKPRVDDRLRISSLDESKIKSVTETKAADVSDQGTKDEKATKQDKAGKSDPAKTEVANSNVASQDASKVEPKNKSTTPAIDPATGNPPIIYKERVEKSDEQLEAEQKARDAKQKEIPIDEEFAELEAAKIEFGEVIDNTISVGKLEMNIYRRLVRWVDAQSFEQLTARATKQFRYSDLITRAHDSRGKLIKTDMTLVRVVKLDDVKGFEPHEELYEIWCKNDESKEFFYECVVTELPKELIPPNVSLTGLSEKVSFVGYFFKVQGYLSGDRHRDRAPLLVGRVQWHPRQSAVASSAVGLDSTDYSTLWWLFGLGIIFMGYLGLRFWLKPSSAVPDRLVDRALDEATFDDWLDSSNDENSIAHNKSSRNGPAFDWQSDNDSINNEKVEPGEEWKSSYQ